MTRTIHFPPPAGAPHHVADGSHMQLIYTRAHWGDPWLLVPELYATEVTWSAAPTLPVAVLEMDYGLIAQPYRSSPVDVFAEVAKGDATNLVGQFVKIICYTQVSESSPVQLDRTWYGIIEESHDEQGGVDPDTGRSTGRVTLVAYGLEKLLADHQILTSWCANALEIGIPLGFNRAGPKGIGGNRAPDPFLGTYRFACLPSTAVTWSTRNIVEYLLANQVPHDQANVRQLHWLLDPAAVPFLPDTDTPLLPCESATTYSLLSQLIDRRRGLMWWAEIDPASGAAEPIYLHVNSINASDVVGSKITIPANTDQVNVLCDNDPMTAVVVNSSDLPRYDQVAVRGARIRCVGTFSAEDGTLEPAWTTPEEEEYEAGGTPHPAGTAGLTKETRNTTVRTAPKLAQVYAVFRIPEDWDGYVGDGEGGATNPMFVDSDSAPQDQCYMQLSLDQTLPIVDGEDYSGTRVRAGLVPREMVNETEMRPLCFLRRPYRTTAPYKYQPCEGVNAGRECTKPKDNERLQCRLSIPDRTMTVRLDVQGLPQHAIAYSDFTPIDGEDKAVGQFDWRQAVFTLAITSQFHLESAWPTVPAVSDAVRRKVIFAGESLYQHYIAPQTVVGVDEDGYLVRSDGGWIPTLGDPADPLPILQDIAKISAAWYCVTHSVLALQTYWLRPASDVPIGSLIGIAGGGTGDHDGHQATVNAPITQVTFRFPRGTGDKTPPATMQVRTWAGELDAVEFVAIKPPRAPQRRPGRAPGGGVA